MGTLPFESLSVRLAVAAGLIVAAAALWGASADPGRATSQPPGQQDREDSPSSPAAEEVLSPDDREELLRRHRNLGKALYENPATQYDAVPEFEKALALAPDSARERVNLGLALLRAGETEKGIAQLERAQKQDPSIPHTWFNLGIAYKRASEYGKAIRQLEGMLERVPDEPITHYNLGVLYKLEGEADKALRHFERAAELDPGLAGPHFQLATAYRQAGRTEDATRAMERFRELKVRDAGAAVPEDLEWSWYAEIYEVIDPEPRPAPSEPPAFAVTELARDLDPDTAGLEVLEADGEPLPDLLAWSATRVRLFLGGSRPVEPSESGLGELRGVHHAAAGDFDNDGLHDLAVLTGERVVLLANRGGRFAPAGELPESANRPFDRVLWLDADHDYDLDLLLFGERPALLRNDGDGTWSDRTDAFPFDALEKGEGGGRVVAAVRFDLVADTQGMDVAVARESAEGVLFRDLLGGRYEARPLPALPAGTRALVAADVDHDGWTDLVAGGADGVTVLRNRHRFGEHLSFQTVVVAGGVSGGGAPLAVVDLANRGAADLVAGGRLFRDLGRLRFEDRFEKGGGTPKVLESLAGGRALVAADFDAAGDAGGRTDLAAITAEGAVLLLRNETRTDHGWLRVGLTGVKNPKLAPGAEVEVKAGSLYQKKLYEGVPLVFGLADTKRAEAVRITWPNGLIQNETRQEAGTSAIYEEAQRLSGSCPMIFTWNGESFEFITDVLGVAPLGASAGDGEYFPTDHDEVIRIPAESLAETPEGRYEIRITEELREVAYLDRIRLLAVDHPAEIDIFTNDKFKGPPFPEFRLFGVGERHHPVAARDHLGRDVLDRLLAQDATYPDGFARDHSGLAELHHLELDFGEGVVSDGRALLVLSGWVDWADGSTFLASAQGEGPGLVLPRLQVRDETGEWVTVIEDMGMPAGKPKTIVVDLTGRLPSASREIRIVTSACVYWDEIFLGEDVFASDLFGREGPEASGTRLAEVPAVEAELRFRGFSRPVIHPQRLQPERFVYADRRPVSHWNPTPGLYTRYGEVTELLSEIDDRFVVMGSGDEIRLSYDARALPPPRDGRRRDFLLWVDGWAKDGDANTAHSQTVEPLPYRGMPGYPYEPPHGYPDDPAHRLYREHYLTRPAMRPIRPLTEGTPADPRRRRTHPALALTPLAPLSQPTPPPSRERGVLPLTSEADSRERASPLEKGGNEGGFSRESPVGPPPAPFTDVTESAGIRFVHSDGATGEKLLPETMGGGVAFFDYDRDGDPDLLFVDSAGIHTEGRGAVLYRNDGRGDKGEIRFRDVTEAAGLAAAVRIDPEDPWGSFYGQGVAVGDYDGDGWPDLYLTSAGRNRLLRNREGVFEDVTETAGVGGGEAWSTGAAFFDADGDGDLDLFVCNYLDWSPATDRAPERVSERTVEFAGGEEGLTYGRPQSYRGAHPFLYRNDGARFTEVAREAGLHVVEPASGGPGAPRDPVAKALAVAPLDVDLDGRTDLLVTSDTTRNLFFHNLGPENGLPRFEETGVLFGLAYDPHGQTTGAMGLDWGYLDGSADLAVVVGNFSKEATSFYRAQGDPTFFADEALRVRIGTATHGPLTFGLLLLDYDLDGRLDLVQANGHVESDIGHIEPRERHRQPAQLFWNAGNSRPGEPHPPHFVQVPEEATGDLARPLVGRGAAYADFDGDGDLDVVLTQIGGPPQVLRNDQRTGHHWLRLRLEDRPPNRHALGARIALTAGGHVQRREIVPTRSYLSQVELPVTFGLGEAGTVERLEVTWPDGTVEVLPVPAVDRLLVVERGHGKASEPAAASPRADR